MSLAALFVEEGGVYCGLDGIDAWPIDRDARQYNGPHPVIAHPPCERWGRFWHGSTRKPHQFQMGDDGGCFSAALSAVRRFGGVLEHPAHSHAWPHFGISTPSRDGGWQSAGQCGGLTCYVEQGFYGHQSRKPTWLYYHGPERPPELLWGVGEQRIHPRALELHGYEKARRIGMVAMIGGKDKKRIRDATPPEFRDTLISIASCARKAHAMPAISSAPIVPTEVALPDGRVPLHTILQGDCRKILRAMPSESVHCIVTSPPYFGLRDYGVSGQIGLEASVSEHMRIMVEVFEECRRVLRKDGTLWLNYGDAYASSVNGRSAADTKALSPDDRTFRDKPLDTVKASGLKPKDLMGLPWRLAFALQDAGWYLRSDIIWRKPNPMPESTNDRPTRAHEYVFLLTKRAKYFYDADAIRTPIKDVTAKRLTQATFDTQDGGSKDSLTGNRSHRKALNNQREKLIAGEKWGSRHMGWEEAKAAMAGANARDVWDIATEPFGAEFCTACRTYFDGAEKKLIRVETVGERKIRYCPCGASDAWLSHFATFPTELARRCIAAGSPEKCCAECGAPYRRASKKTFKRQSDVSDEKNARAAHQHDSMSRRAGSARGHVEITPGALAPTCACSADAMPAIVLDPFGGAGTVAMVATALGRRSQLCELNPDYVDLAENRIRRHGKKKPTAKAVRERQSRAKSGPDLVDMAQGLPSVAAAPISPGTPHTQRPDKQSGHGRRHAGFNARYFGVPPTVDPKPTIELEDWLAENKEHPVFTEAGNNHRPSPTERVIAERRSTKIISR